MRQRAVQLIQQTWNDIVKKKVAGVPKALYMGVDFNSSRKRPRYRTNAMNLLQTLFQRG